MRVGLVSPYSFDVHGGVQIHVRELAEHLIGVGHQVSVLAPAESTTRLPEYVVSAGGAVPVRYNGSVARLAFGPNVAARVRDWVEHGSFDVVHIHEPASPSVSLLALWAMAGPVVATFHSSQIKSRTLRLAGPMLQPGLDKISARIAVSEEARRTVLEQLGGDCVVIPNGVDTSRFAGAAVMRAGRGVRTGSGPTMLFLGRVEEPRKGLSVLLRAMPRILADCPGARLVVAGPGDAAEVLEDQPAEVRAACVLVGAVDERDKVGLMADCDLYIAPNTGGESFGIILVEALSAGAPVVASDLVAFEAVLKGEEHGALFPVGDVDALGARVVSLWHDPERRRLLQECGPVRAADFDWGRVVPHIEAVYDSVRAHGSSVGRHVPVLRRIPRRPRRRRPHG
ncbi:glycosyltransferase family 4 protein [Ornithinimicrobium sediminis]|uniref:glycosyltransferase family 4 protein n=1 Tax=Ornithinimicrobium sediminis TaxID=2904603 RepID=UPI001E5B2ECA|nr:glycosyltransferase family 4 protein [Ornithinimicrobium sediminis]MCE0487777.1 glycosyltransferase family 4 protein [Ornithinimicrobium sediminis]